MTEGSVNEKATIIKLNRALREQVDTLQAQKAQIQRLNEVLFSIYQSLFQVADSCGTKINRYTKWMTVT